MIIIIIFKYLISKELVFVEHNFFSFFFFSLLSPVSSTFINLFPKILSFYFLLFFSPFQHWRMIQILKTKQKKKIIITQKFHWKDPPKLIRQPIYLLFFVLGIHCRKRKEKNNNHCEMYFVHFYFVIEKKKSHLFVLNFLFKIVMGQPNFRHSDCQLCIFLQPYICFNYYKNNTFFRI